MQLAIVPAMSRIAVGRRHRILVNGFVCQTVVEALESFYDRLGDNGIRRGADHDVGVRRVRPLGHPTALLVILQESVHHAGNALRSDDREETVLSAIGVPPGIGGVRVAGMDPIIETAVVAALLRDRLGIQQRMIESGIEDRLLVWRSAVDHRNAELLVPECFQLLRRGMKIPAGEFGIEVGASLLKAYE